MNLKFGKRTLFIVLFTVLAAICVALTICFLLPSSKTQAVDAEGNSHSHSDDGWSKLTSTGTVSLSSGSYYLTGTLKANITIPSGSTVTLCLNGNTLKAKKSSKVVIDVAESANFTLCDCSGNNSGKITGASRSSSYGGGGVYVHGNAVFTMYGGTITGNSVGYGGGVYVDGDATFIMNGGAISDNKTNGTRYGGGGVFVAYSGTFIMNDGTISGNTASISGGGVYLLGGTTTFTMNGGTISGNTAKYFSGGVYVKNGATFTMNDGTISGNTTSYLGGGVYVKDGATFTMNDGTISGNTAGNGSGVYVYWDGSFVVTGGYISGTVTISNAAEIAVSGGYLSSSAYDSLSSYITSGYSAVSTNDSAYPYVVLSDEEASLVYNSVTYNTVLTVGGTLSAGYYYLVSDVDLSSDITISSGTVYLNLNGYTITGTGKDSVITVSGGTLILCDSSEEESGVITGGKASYGGGIDVSNGTLTMYGGTISGNTASINGGGVRVHDGTFSMYGGTISGNTASSYGGGVRVYNSTFTMNGGTVSDNSAIDGGGVSVSTGEFTMNDGDISDNAASGNGGGVYVYNSSTFTMAGGTISGNTASSHGGGVCVDSGTFTMTGGTISDNTASYGGGVHIVSGVVYTMTGGAISDNTATINAGGISVSGTFNMNGGTISGNTASKAGDGMRVNSTGTLNMTDGTITDNSVTAIYIYKGTAVIEGGTIGDKIYNDSGTLTIYNGYYGGTYSNTSGTLTVYGGYFNETAYSSFKSSMSSASDVINLCEFYSLYGSQPDEGYSADYPYAVYAKGTYSISNITTTYGTSYAVTVGGTYLYKYVIYTWDGVTGTELPTEAGTYTVTATVISLSQDNKLYTGTTSFTIAIQQKNLKQDMFHITGTYIYNGEEQNASYTFKDTDSDGAVLTEDDFEAEYSYNTESGTAILSFIGKNNYTGTVELTYKIEKASYDMGDVSLKNLTVTYNGSAQALEITGTLPEDVEVTYYYEGTNGTDYTKSTTAPTNAGTYTVTAEFSGDENYNSISYMSATLTIEKANYDTKGLTFENLIVTYNGEGQALAVSGLPAGVEVTYYYEGAFSTTYAKSTVAPIDAGSYTVTAEFSGDYDNYNAISSLTATLVIEKANAEVEAITNVTAHVGDSLEDIELPEGWTWSSTATFSSAGEYEVEATYCAGDNYETVTQTITVSVSGYSAGDIVGIVGIVVGCIGLAGIGAAVTTILIRRKRR